MKDNNWSPEFYHLNKNPRFTPNWGPEPAGTRQKVTFSMPRPGKPEEILLDEIMGTWQEDGTMILDRPIHFELEFHWIEKPKETQVRQVRQKPKTQPEQQASSDDDYKERQERQKQWEIKHYGKEVALYKNAARGRAAKGEVAVPYRYYKAVNRVLVRKDAMERDFDEIYDYVCDVLGPNPVVAIDEDEYIHFGRKK